MHHHAWVWNPNFGSPTAGTCLSPWSWPSPCPGMCTGSETLHPSSGLALISWSSWPGDRYYHHRRHQSEWSLNVDPGDRDYFDNGDSDNIEGRERSWESSLRLSKERSSKQLIPRSGSYRQSYHEFKYKVPSNQQPKFLPPKKCCSHQGERLWLPTHRRRLQWQRWRHPKVGYFCFLLSLLFFLFVNNGELFLWLSGVCNQILTTTFFLFTK